MKKEEQTEQSPLEGFQAGQNSLISRVDRLVAALEPVPEILKGLATLPTAIKELSSLSSLPELIKQLPAKLDAAIERRITSAAKQAEPKAEPTPALEFLSHNDGKILINISHITQIDGRRVWLQTNGGALYRDLSDAELKVLKTEIITLRQAPKPTAAPQS